MSESVRRRIVWGMTAALAAVVAVGLFIGPERPPDRVEQLAARVRCPVCQGESVADSPSETARAMREIIAEHAEAGRSDREILDYFVARYGSWVLLDPPARGSTLLLWLLPGLALLAGAVILLARVRGRSLPPEETVLHRPARIRMLIGTASVVTVLALVAFLAIRAAGPRAAGTPVTGEGGRDPATVTNEEMEEVIAANPEIVGMRLALANRYFEAGRFSEALAHYQELLQRRPDHPEALARMGWMAYLSGEPETAARLEERALQAAPDYAEAKWFLANVRLYGLNDADGAIPLFEELLGIPDLPDEVRSQVEERLREAEAAS